MQARPRPTIKWTRDGLQVGEAYINDLEGITQLQIRGTRSWHTGTYTVQLDNASGRKKLDIKVTVIGLFIIFTIPVYLLTYVFTVYNDLIIRILYLVYCLKKLDIKILSFVCANIFKFYFSPQTYHQHRADLLEFLI